VDREVKEICAKAVKSFSDLGVEVEEDCPDLHDAEEIFEVLRAVLVAGRMAPLLETHRNQLIPEVVWNIEKGLMLTGEEISRANRAHGALYHRTVNFFEKHDLLISPTVVTPPFDVNTRYVTEVEGVSFSSYFGWLVMTYAITLTACPAISLPCGFTRTGLPVGLQIVGPPRGEVSLLGAAALFEEIHDLASRVPIEPHITTVGDDSK
jgi:amidase